MTKIVRCNGCKAHAFQDNKYGSFMRVANSCGTGDNIKWRCTVCGKEVGENLQSKKK
jgi:hypothetical protein